MEMTKKQALIFTSIMCFFMVLVMSVYNLFLYQGVSDTFLIHLAVGFVPAYVCAFFCDVVIVSTPAKAIAFKIVKKSDKPFKKIVVISFFMVCGMVLCMSLFGVVMNVGLGTHMLKAYLKGVALNFVVALPLQLLIVGPLTRAIYLRFFPVKAESVE